MKRHLHAIIIISLIFILSFIAYGYKIYQDDKPLSLTEYNKITGNKEKTVLVYFNAKWCMICAKMKPLVEEIEKNHSKQIEVLRIDTDKDKEVAHEFEIDALPVFILYKNGNRTWVHAGIIEKEKLFQNLGLP